MLLTKYSIKIRDLDRVLVREHARHLQALEDQVDFVSCSRIQLRL